MPGKRIRNTVFFFKNDLFWKKVAKIKAIADRERQYLAWFNFLMISYLFLKDIGWSWWFLLAIPLAGCWSWIEITYIMPRENDYHQTKTPIKMEMYNDIKWIKKKLNNKPGSA